MRLRAYVDMEGPDQPAHLCKMYEWRAKAKMMLLHAQDDLNLCILHMFEGTFSLDAAHIKYKVHSGKHSITILLYLFLLKYSDEHACEISVVPDQTKNRLIWVCCVCHSGSTLTHISM